MRKEKGKYPLLGKSLLTTWSQANVPVMSLLSQFIQSHKDSGSNSPCPPRYKDESIVPSSPNMQPSWLLLGIHPPCDFKTRPSWTKPWTFPFCTVSSTGGCEGAALHHDGLMQINHSRWWFLAGLTAPMAIHFGKDHIFLIADPQISTVLWLTLVESKANF